MKYTKLYTILLLHVNITSLPSAWHTAMATWPKIGNFIHSIAILVAFQREETRAAFQLQGNVTEWKTTSAKDLGSNDFIWRHILF